MMWTLSGKTRLAGVALLVCLLLVIGTTLGAGSSKAAGIQDAPVASSAEESGKQAGEQPATPSPKPLEHDYLIGPSDVLAINVWRNPDLSRTVSVRPDGKISLPLIGELQVGGVTAVEVQRLVTQKMREFIADPEVAVIVEQVKSRTYAVLGKVTKPGSYELAKPTTVLEAIAIAGGFMEFAKKNKISIIRPRSSGSPETLYFDYKKVTTGRNPEQNVELKSGDTIVVP